MTALKDEPVFTAPAGVKVLKEHHFDYASIRVRSDGIVQVNSGEIYYTMIETMAVHEKINELSNNQPMLILHVPGEFANVDEETRRFLASEFGLRYVIAQAFVLNSMAQRIVANFFMKINKPIKPTKFFTSQEDAEKWLLSFNKK